MASRAKFGIAAVMMLLVVATAPAVLCLGYLAQSTQAHHCCPSKTAPALKPTCCIHAPAVTSPSVDIPAPSVASTAVAVDPLVITARVESVSVQDPDTSPPLCNSILRI
jgi:hypothetical protein